MSRLIAGFVAITILAGCTTGYSHHGIPIGQEEIEGIIVGADTGSSVVEKFGSPSFTGTLDDKTIVYMSSYKQHSSVFKAKTISRQITVFRLNEDERIIAADTYSLDSGRDFAFASETTSTQGRRATLLEQIFGAIGLNLIGTTLEEPGS